MAILKKIKLDNGIELNYHRITSITKITNVCNKVEISSYIDEEQRLKEKEYQELQTKNINKQELTKEENQKLNEGINVFIRTNFVNLEYNDKMNIEDTYNYLKTTDEFKKSKDN